MTEGDVGAALVRVMDEEHGRLQSVLIGQLGDIQLAEDCLQEAMASALDHWHRSGIPSVPAAWLLKVARRKAIDRLRRASVAARKAADYDYLLRLDQEAAGEPQEIPDERLRLIFTCCHPALEQKSRVALTLRLLGGLTTPEIARAFLDRETTMGQRLSRAKAKIRAARIPFEVPQADQWSERLNSVLTVIYLIFNEGYSAAEGDLPVRRALCDEAIHLARMLIGLRPGEAEAEGLLALMLLTHARHAARHGADGVPVPVDRQDRSRWDPAMIDEGQGVLDRAVARHATGPFQIKAAIAALHAQAAPGAAPDWRQILLLYDALLVHEPTPVVALNRAVALAEWTGAAAGLAALEPLEQALEEYQPFHAARAELLARDGRSDEAQGAYDRAIELCRNPADIRFLKRRQAETCEWPEKKRPSTKLGRSPTGRYEGDER